ncbi:MAG: hypothetical protein GXO81_05645 [Chlorobi bacterium]|nr:hypothetical protein [Chlorobiota bacterium]
MMEDINNTIIKPENEVQEKLYQIWSDTLQTNNFGADDSFFNVGGYSLQAIPLVAKIEEAFNKEIDLYSFFTDPTISGLERLIRANHSGQPALPTEKEPGLNNKPGLKNFAAIKPEGKKPPFIMVHGDNCNNFLPRLLDKEQPYLGYFHLGSEGEEFGFKDLQEIVNFYIDQLLSYRPRGPYLLGGHSFGGIIAFEMAVQLQQRGFEVPLVVLSDSVIPEKNRIFRLKRGVRGRIETSFKRKLFKTYIKKGKPIPVKHRQFYILDSYQQLVENYKPQKYNGPVLLFRASKNKSKKKFLGWDKVSNDIEMVILEGTHNEIINNEKSIRGFVNTLNNKLEVIQAQLSETNEHK